MLERDGEVRELVSQIVTWRDKRGQYTDMAAKIARDPRATYLKGENPEKQIAELNKKINDGNAKCHVAKERIRVILQETLQGFKVHCDAAIMGSHEARFGAARLLREAADKVHTLAATAEVNAVGIHDFNELVKAIEKLVVEGGEGALPRATESLKPPNFVQHFDLNSLAGKAEAVIRRMAEILST
jgi:hypothetical protein